MSALMDALMGLLSGADAILDTPGAIVRNSLAGQNPLQGLFNPEERTYGRDLLEQWGMLDENKEGMDWGDAAGLGVDMVTDPLSILGLGKAAGGLGRMAGRYADEAVKGGPTLGVFGGTLGDFSKYGVSPKQMAPKEMGELFEPWAKSLSPEEAEAIRLFTTGPQSAISGTLRGTPDPGYILGNVDAASPTIRTADDVLREVAPYADSAMLKGMGAIPSDMMTYRVADRMGGLNAANAESLIGQTVSDPSYLSTIVNPYGPIYGNIPNQADQIRFDIMVPKGAPSSYPNAGRLSGYPGEQELMLPRNLPMEVLDTQKNQVARIDPLVRGASPKHVNLTPSGVPIPQQAYMPTDKAMAQVFNYKELEDYLRSTKVADDAIYTRFPTGSWAEPVPKEVLAKGWEDVIANAPKEDYLNVLLKAKPEGLPAFDLDSGIRRLSKEEKVEVLKELLPAARRQAHNPEMLERRVKLALDLEPSPAALDNAINKALGFTDGKLNNLLKYSVPKQDPIRGMMAILRKAGVPLAVGGAAASPLLNALLAYNAAQTAGGY